MKNIIINTRNLGTHLTGVQRYTNELVHFFQSEAVTVAPRSSLHGLSGHAWEQVVLPFHVKGRLLFSPSNTGPLSLKHQVVTIHDLAVFDHPEGFSSKFAAWYRYLLPRLARNVERVITVSTFTKNRLIEITKVNPDKIIVIPNGVDKRFKPQPESAIEQLVSAHGLPTRYYVLSLGSLVPRKNLARLLKAWQQIVNCIPKDVWLVVAGGGGDNKIFSTLERKEKLPERVHFTGYVPDTALPALYGGALLFAYPSLYEGFGLPLLEAMASGTPVLASNVSALPEAVGDSALTVNPHDTEAIADGLLRLIESSELRKLLSESGMKRANKFSWVQTAEKTLHVLNELA